MIHVHALVLKNIKIVLNLLSLNLPNGNEGKGAKIKAGEYYKGRLISLPNSCLCVHNSIFLTTTSKNWSEKNTNSNEII